MGRYGEVWGGMGRYVLKGYSRKTRAPSSGSRCAHPPSEWSWPTSLSSRAAASARDRRWARTSARNVAIYKKDMGRYRGDIGEI